MIGTIERKVLKFDPQVYPFKVWVAQGVDFEYMSNNFYALVDGFAVDITKEMWSEQPHNKIMTVYPVATRDSLLVGAIAIVRQPKDVGVKTMAHEATHITDLMCEELGIDGCNYSYSGGEARAYFAGWVAECIDKALTAFNNQPIEEDDEREHEVLLYDKPPK